MKTKDHFAEDSILSKDHLLFSILTSIGDAVISTDINSLITYINPAAENLTAWTLEEAIGKKVEIVLNIINAESGIKMENPLEKAIKIGNPLFLEKNTKLINKKNKEIYIEDTTTPIKDEDGIALGAVIIFRDITQRMKWEATLVSSNLELKKINYELDRFVYSTSHDLRAPLASIQGLIKIAEMDKDPLKTCIYLKKIEKNVKKLDGFIQDIVNYSRNARIDVQSEKIDFKNLFSEVIENLKFIQGAERIKFHIEEKTEVDFFSDKNRIRTLINNLISNAIKYHNYQQEHLFIEINILLTKENGLIIIKDNGQGIPEKYHSKIFEMFFRASEKSEGSGLGLYIVKEIIDKLKGTIAVQSKPGIGTTFIINIPNHMALVKSE